jgi:glycine cleavage system protein P-like pyridoxal-binding family
MCRRWSSIPALASFVETGLPEIGQLELVRHYTHLSHRTFSIDANFYPLGSCTMKYNPKVNEWAAALSGFANLHPMQSEEQAQGALGLLYNLRLFLQEISGLDEVSLQPAAGAHGEWTALKVIRAYYKDHGQPKRRIVLAPDTAHGTNPASCAMCGAGVINIKSLPNGLTDLEDLKAHLNDEVAAVMVTNPNTVGKFDSHIVEMAKLIHDAGAFPVSRRRQHERDSRHRAAGRFWRRCDALQHAQNLQHAARLRRAGRGADRGAKIAGALSAGAAGDQARRKLRVGSRSA